MNAEQTKSLTFYGRQEFAMIPILLYVILGGAIMIGFQYYSMKVLIFAAIVSMVVPLWSFVSLAAALFQWAQVHRLRRY